MWLQSRNKKNLVRRTRYKQYQKYCRTAKKSLYSKQNDFKNFNQLTKRYEFKVPLDFSFLTNPEETISFFNEMILLIRKKEKMQFTIYIDIAGVKHLTIDALMYLLAIINNMRNIFKRKVSIMGNSPLDSEINRLFKESGFFNYVKTNSVVPISKNSDKIQIISVKNSDTRIARQISDFVSLKLGLSRSECSFIYIMMIELMSNTFKHAYNGKGLFSNRWYCFCKYDRTEQRVAFTFMDVGAGIPTTVRKNFIEKLDILKLKGEHQYVISALEGKFRTNTELKYRGKGLPKIHETCKSRKIINMRIVTNRADVKDDGVNIKGSELSTSLCGTLYYCELRKGVLL